MKPEAYLDIQVTFFSVCNDGCSLARKPGGMENWTELLSVADVIPAQVGSVGLSGIVVERPLLRVALVTAVPVSLSERDAELQGCKQASLVSIPRQVCTHSNLCTALRQCERGIFIFVPDRKDSISYVVRRITYVRIVGLIYLS